MGASAQFITDEAIQAPTNVHASAGGNADPNNHNLPRELQECLRQLCAEFSLDGMVARREEVRRVKKNHEFWKGLQYIYWSDRDQAWHLPYDAASLTSENENDLARYEYVTNIFQAFGLSIIAVLSQDIPSVRIFPQSAQNEQDVAKAKAATTIVELIERNNDPVNLLKRLCFLLWCDGRAGAYVRYVADSSRFGSSEEDELEPSSVKLGEDAYECPGCGSLTPPEQFEQTGICQGCGNSMDSALSYRPSPVSAVPRVKQTTPIPNGQEVIDIVGALELRAPLWTHQQHEFPYLQWATEVHKSRLKAAYPNVADKIGEPTAGGAEGLLERIARISLTSGNLALGGQQWTDLITFQRTWIRPWAFYGIEDKGKRQQLLELFPDGCYVAFAGDVYCESRNESMDKRWVVAHALPGDGQSRPALGDAIVSVQERFNTLSNLQLEIYEHGIPATYVDSELVDDDSVSDSINVPGAQYFVNARPGMPLGASFHESTPGQAQPDLVKHAADLMGPISQFLTGAFPSLFGGEMGGNDTASGYAMARDQAMGRIGLVWREIKAFYAKMMMLGIGCFSENRTDDVDFAVLGDGKEFTTKQISAANLRGSIQVYPESDEHYPALWSQKRAVLMQLLQSPDPGIQQILSHPANSDTVKSLIGLRDMVVPDAESRDKQMREIAQLLQGSPQPQIDPQTGQETGLLPSVMPDAQMDNNGVEFAVCQEWADSSDGQQAKIVNPSGFLNVRAHALLHKQYMISQQQQAMAVAAPARAASPQPSAQAPQAPGA